MSVTTIHSFIVKIWIERAIAETGEVSWQGHITHVPSNVRSYFKNLNAIAGFITPYLDRPESTPEAGKDERQET